MKTYTYKIYYRTKTGTKNGIYEAIPDNFKNLKIFVATGRGGKWIKVNNIVKQYKIGD